MKKSQPFAFCPLFTKSHLILKILDLQRMTIILEIVPRMSAYKFIKSLDKCIFALLIAEIVSLDIVYKDIIS